LQASVNRVAEIICGGETISTDLYILYMTHVR
jgi:hypothetical protein